MTRGDTTMKGILITNAFMRQGSFARMRELFEQAAQRAGISLIPRVNTDFMLMPPSAHLKVDFVLFYDKDIRLAARLEAMGLPVFNGAKAIALCDDKTLTYLALQRAGVRQPDTVLCPQTFPGLGYGDMDFLQGVGAALSWPMVIKEGCGSFGEQVYLAQDEAQARDILHRIGAKPALFQRFIAYSAGRDRRATGSSPPSSAATSMGISAPISSMAAWRAHISPRRRKARWHWPPAAPWGWTLAGWICWRLRTGLWCAR